ncbi:MAG: DUF6399 domain-containing protein [Xenococcaceae cyanobacterium]
MSNFRNGYLSRLHNSGRGLSEKDLEVLTVIHNFDLKRADGSGGSSSVLWSGFSGIISLANVKNSRFARTKKAPKI